MTSCVPVNTSKNASTRVKTDAGAGAENGIDPYDLAVGADDHSVTVGDFRGTIDLGTGTPVSPVGGSGPYMITYKP